MYCLGTQELFYMSDEWFSIVHSFIYLLKVLTMNVDSVSCCCCWNEQNKLGHVQLEPWSKKNFEKFGIVQLPWKTIRYVQLLEIRQIFSFLFTIWHETKSFGRTQIPGNITRTTITLDNVEIRIFTNYFSIFERIHVFFYQIHIFKSKSNKLQQKILVLFQFSIQKVIPCPNISPRTIFHSICVLCALKKRIINENSFSKGKF